MNEEIKNYFAAQYNKITPSENLRQKLLKEGKKQIYVFAIVASSVFLFSIFSILLHFSQLMDDLIATILLP